MSVSGKGGRPPGLPKTGGRKKGTPNRATVAVAEKLAAIGCDPIQELARIAMDEREETGHRIRALIELCSYVVPGAVARHGEGIEQDAAAVLMGRRSRPTIFCGRYVGPVAQQTCQPARTSSRETRQNRGTRQ